MKYLEKNTVLQMDAIEGMSQIEPHSIDLIIADLPYGQTSNKYDVIIPFDKMWEAIHRVIKPNGAVCLFGEGRFYIQMSASNLNEWRHEYSWNKSLTSGFLSSGWQPLRQHENIAVFYAKKPTYNPQFTKGAKLHSKGKSFQQNPNFLNNNYNAFNLSDDSRAGSTDKYPTDILTFPVKDEDIEFYVEGKEYDEQIFEVMDFVEFKKVHPSKAIHYTEKPAALCDFLIRTYSNEGDTVLDFCMGSGPTILSAKRNKRSYFGFDIGECLNPKSPYFNMSWADVVTLRLKEQEKINKQVTFDEVVKTESGEQLSLIA